MTLKLVTEPTVEPVTLAEAKAHLRVDIPDEDALISRYIRTARQVCEVRRRESFITQTYDLYLDAWPAGGFKLPMGPVQSITSIVYYDEDGNEATWDSSNYITDLVSQPARIVLKSSTSYPSTVLQEVNGVRVRFVAGYGATGASVPEHIRSAMLLLIGHYYENREAVVIGSGLSVNPLPEGVNHVLMRRYNV